MKNPFSTRDYKPEDKSAIMEVFKLNTPKFFDTEEEKYLSNYLDNEREIYYSLLFRNSVIGGAGINFADDGKTGKLSWCLIHPDYQRHGLGTLLLSKRIHTLKSNPKVEKIIVRTSQLVYQFYEKNGFELIQTEKDYWAKDLDLYLMKFNKI